MMQIKKIFAFFISITIFNSNLHGQNCYLLDSILNTNKKYILGSITKDSLILSENSNVKDKFISDAFNLLELKMKNRFYLLHNCSLQKKKHLLYFNIVEFRKDNEKRLLEGYEWTGCPSFYRRINKAIFKIIKGKVIFVKWDLE